MKSKVQKTTKDTIRKARWNFTFLIFGIVFFLFLTIAVIFMTMNLGYMIKGAYSDMYNLCVNSFDASMKQDYLARENDMKSSFSYGDLFLPDHLISQDAFVIVKNGTDDFEWIYGDKTKEINVTIFEQIKDADLSYQGKNESAVGDFFYGVYNSYAYNYDIIPQTPSAEFYLKSSQVIYVVMNGEKIVEATRKVNVNLVIILIVILIAMFPLTVYISGILVEPTEQALEKEKLFVSNSSHELKTPLAIIKANGTVLAQKFPEAKKYVDVINGECDRLNQSVVDMINLSKLEIMKFNSEDVDISSMVLNLCISFDAIAFENNIDYSYNIEPNLILKKSDKKVLQRCLDILFGNAMKYVQGPKKEIRVSLTKVKNKVSFSIYNTGCEILDEDIDKIFDRFYQGNSSSEIERKGSGLGLAILQQACSEMGYGIAVESTYHQSMKFTIKF